MTDTIQDLKHKIEFIYEQLTKDFETPCNFSPIDEIMFENGKCEKDCGNVPIRKCWKRYFEEMQRRSRQ